MARPSAGVTYDTDGTTRVPSSAAPPEEFPSGPLPAASPSAEFPSGPLPPSGLAQGEFPSQDLPAARVPARQGAGAPATSSRERADSRRRPSKAQQPAKNRSRQRGKRNDDDDEWPSTEWDKLSDEQYWAELSADKPLASTSRTTQPSGPPARSAPPPSPAPARAVASGTTRPRTSADERSLPEAARPGGPVPTGQEEKASLPSRKPRAAQREPITERLPAHPRQQREAPPAPTRQPAGDWPTGPTSPLADRSQPAAAAGPPSSPGAPLDDDPLTSPSFSLRAASATDSRSYNSTRRHEQTAGPASGRHRGGGRPGTDAGYGSGAPGDRGPGAAPGDYTSPGYAYPHDEPAAAEWYRTPQPPAPGNPYQSYPEPVPPAGTYPSIPPAGYGDISGGAGYGGYGTGYAEPAYSPASPPYPSPAAGGQGQPSVGGYVPYSQDAYPAASGYGNEQPGQPWYPDGYSNGGYAPGYAAGHDADPYPDGGYGRYPSQG